ncbi:TraR/DksA family transcriptional regulator [Mucisphaera calidilacus]|uniref:General stress protein 16O n=1 Tax=Mucisphaera calidilacus TaxID=2527982 RepID=A0A518BW35_9BACT|nr:TraR/DksA C4-type zinc finger protein [Mucisphaera calidilacus]QDU71193.1 General stress protein 16O [Mucisphaera calidilacus]
MAAKKTAKADKKSKAKKTSKKGATQKVSAPKSAAGGKKVAKKTVKKKSTKKVSAAKVAKTTKKTAKKSTKKSTVSKTTKASKAKAASGTTKKKAPTKPSKAAVKGAVTKTRTAKKSESVKKSAAPAKKSVTPKVVKISPEVEKKLPPIKKLVSPFRSPPTPEPVAEERREWTVAELKKVKSGLNKKDLQQFRMLLLERRAEIIGSVTGMESARADRGDETSNMPLHMADVGSENFEQEFTLGLMESEQRLLAEINQALQRIADGYYGVCMESGKPINRERLEAKPWAKYTIEVARERERRGLSSG